jgi:hypothetical protein
VAREAVARSAAPLPGMPGSDIGGPKKAAADATPVTATKNTPLYISLIRTFRRYVFFFFSKGVSPFLMAEASGIFTTTGRILFIVPNFNKY